MASLEAATVSPCWDVVSEVLLGPSGIIPSEGKPEMACACSGVRTVLSTPSSRKARPIPLVRPRTKPKPRLRGILGSAGLGGGGGDLNSRRVFVRKAGGGAAFLVFLGRGSRGGAGGFVD